MTGLTITLFERLGLLLIIAFVMTRTPGFHSMLYRQYNVKMSLVHTAVFGLFGIASTIIGIVMTNDGDVSHRLVFFPVDENHLIVSLSLVAIVIAGLLGGPVLGFGAGMISGIHSFILGGIGGMANALVNPITGLYAGLTAKFFSHERVISPLKAFFIGVFPPILHMQLLLIMNDNKENVISIVNTIGLPLVFSNSTAIAIFTAMISIVLREQENEAAVSLNKALTIAQEALPFLKKDSHIEVATGLAELLYSRLKLAAVTITNQKKVLAQKGLKEEDLHYYKPDAMPLAQRAIQLKKMQVTLSKDDLKFVHKKIPFEGAIFIPIIKDDDVLFLITFYFRKEENISPVEMMMAQGLGKLISDQLTMLEAEKLKAHIRDAELRNLQAQINPHFLFNTLQLIAGLYRENPANARHLTLQLASYMRFNLRLVSKSLVELEKECEHVEAYTSIIRERFKGRIQIHFHKPDDLSYIFIPPSTLQPLVENCVHHGLKNVADGAKINILIEKTGSGVTISVRDNGCGFPEELLSIVGNKPLRKEKSGMGIFNVNQRLVQLLGESARLYICNLPQGGSEVKFMIPYEKDCIEKKVMG